MKEKTEFSNCVKCDIEITDNNLGNLYEIEEKIYCDNCAKDYEIELIKELEKFRNSEKFKDILALRKMILRISENLGNIFDNATGTIQQSVSDYNNYTMFELQIFLIDIEFDIINSLLKDDLGIPNINNPKLNKLKQTILKERLKILSRI